MHDSNPSIGAIYAGCATRCAAIRSMIAVAGATSPPSPTPPGRVEH